MSEPNTKSLARIRFVLVETTHTGNMGAVARSMKTMGLSRLELVRPKQPPDAEALARASGADDVLERAGTHDTLSEALTGCRLVVGASARLRTIEWPQLAPHEAARALLEEAEHGEVALLLGRESSGLTNAELACCHYLVHIPTNPEFRSLNVAAAAQVLAYEIRRNWLERADSPAEAETSRDLATADELEGLHNHFAEAIFDLGFSDPSQSKKLLMRLRRLFNRARLDRIELNILRGILSAAQGRKTPGRFARQVSGPEPCPKTQEGADPG